jgi:hypothetical protein
VIVALAVVVTILTFDPILDVADISNPSEKV